ncbi:MAG TPA: DNA internalization-related competence protein ComEC/Rec2 [Burkholderiales bacterium]|nr:DNA internalization-related competence protein ComEC/Rec2 [Burkholderiales bacterium]
MVTSLYLFALVGGAWLLQQQPLLPDLTGAAALVPLAGAWLILARRQERAARFAGHAAAVATFAVAGYFWAAAQATWKLSDALPVSLEGRDVEITGVVAGMVQPNARGARFAFDVERAQLPAQRLPSRISLMWYADDASASPPWQAGQRWRMTVRLHRPHGNANPHGFDFEAWMLERGIRAAGYVRAQPAPDLLDPMVWRPGYALERAREAVRAHLLRALAGQPYAGVIVALAVGDQQAIPPDQWQIFTRTGVNHLMSISGLHITMVAAMVVLVVSRLWRRSEKLALRLATSRAAAACGLCAAFAYAALSGFAVPAQRTVYMLAVVAAALWSGWAARPTAVLAAAAAFAVILDPMAVISPGFWLSFGAVAIIMLASASRIGRPGWLRAWLQTQWAVTVALVPLLVAMFQQVSLVSPVANAFAIPLVSFVVVPLALAASLLPFDSLAHAAHLAMSPCMGLLGALGAAPAAVWQQHAPVPWTVPLAVAGALWLLLPSGVPARWTGAFLMLPMFLVPPERLPAGQLQVTVLDVGQGLAVVARTPGHALLYDTGPAFTEQIDAGGRIVVPYLRAAGVRRLDAMIVSHGDSDHSGGALSVLQAMPVDWTASSMSQGGPIAIAAGDSRRCVAGQRWEWDGVTFEMLHPQAADYNDRGSKDNDRSCVLRIVSPYGSVLLPGDIERHGEAHLLDSGAGLHADVLLAPHHGSRTSSTPGFVRATAPRLVVFSVGYRNRFGHPHPQVSYRYRQAGGEALRTDVSGAIIVDLGPAGIAVRKWREIDRTYWAGR